MLKTNADRLMEILATKKDIPVRDVAKILGTSTENVERTAKYLEEEGLLRMEYRLATAHLILNDKKDDKKDEKDASDDVQLKVDANIMDIDVEKKIEDKGSQATPFNYSTLGQEELTGTEFSKELSSLPIDELRKKKEEEKKNIQFTYSLGGIGTQGSSQISQETPDHAKDDAKEEEQVSVGEDQSSYSSDSGIQGSTSEGSGPGEGEGTDYDRFRPEPGSVGAKEDARSDSDVNFYKLSVKGGSDESIDPMEILGDDPSRLLKDLTDIERLDMIVEEANKLIDMGQLDHINRIYKEVYDEFSKAENMTPNERDVMTKKIASLFNRIKTIYLKDEIV